MKKVLLCSSPRSGSTFAANLIQSSPEVVFLNEIMTRKGYLLPSLKNREAAGDGNALRKAFEADLGLLLRLTLPYAGNLVHRNRVVKASVFGSLKAATSLLSRLGLRGFGRNPFYWFYYVNSLVEPLVRPFYETQFPKSTVCSCLLLKEVHLWRSYKWFRKMYPEEKIVYLVRDPFAQVASQKKHHGMSDREQNVAANQTVKEDPRTDREKEVVNLRSIYGENDQIDRYFLKSFEETFALLWRLNNDTVVAQMDLEPPSRFLAVRYEDLVDAPEDTILRILKFLELPFSDNLRRYLRVLSSYDGQQRHGRSTFVAGRGGSKERNNKFSASQLEKIGAVLEGSSAMARFGYQKDVS